MLADSSCQLQHERGWTLLMRERRARWISGPVLWRQYQYEELISAGDARDAEDSRRTEAHVPQRCVPQLLEREERAR